jgi:hypothetical protein
MMGDEFAQNIESMGYGVSSKMSQVAVDSIRAEYNLRKANNISGISYGRDASHPPVSAH